MPAQSMYYDGGEYRWAPCFVLDYDDLEMSYTIMWAKTGRTKFVKRCVIVSVAGLVVHSCSCIEWLLSIVVRLNLAFDGEPLEEFMARRERALERRVVAESHAVCCLACTLSIFLSILCFLFFIFQSLTAPAPVHQRLAR